MRHICCGLLPKVQNVHEIASKHPQSGAMLLKCSLNNEWYHFGISASLISIAVKISVNVSLHLVCISVVKHGNLIVFWSALSSRLSMMEPVICTCWAVATMHIQQVPSMQSIPSWTANMKKLDKDANTDTSSMRSRTPSPSCEEKVWKCAKVYSWQSLTRGFLPHCLRNQSVKPEEASILFVTKCPCDECVPLIRGAGITHIYTTDQDRDKDKGQISYLKFSSLNNISKFIVSTEKPSL